MQKNKNKKTLKQKIDREEIHELIQSIEIFDKLDDLQKTNVIEKIKQYLTMIASLSLDVEHAKISIKQLQKLFGFINEHVTPKEVTGIQEIVKIK